MGPRDMATSPAEKATTVALEQPCHFFRLPPELRDMIYKLALAQSQDPDEAVDIREASVPGKALLLTCKEIHNEAVALYAAARREYWSSTYFFVEVSKHTNDHDIKQLLELLHEKDIRLVTKLEFRIPGMHQICMRQVFRDGVWRLDNPFAGRPRLHTGRWTEQAIVVEEHLVPTAMRGRKAMAVPNSTMICDFCDVPYLDRTNEFGRVLLFFWYQLDIDSEIPKALGWKHLSTDELCLMIRKRAHFLGFFESELSGAVKKTTRSAAEQRP